VLGVQYKALGVYGFWVVERGRYDRSGDFDWTAGREQPFYGDQLGSDPSGAVRNGWHSQRYEPEFISSCGTDCSACGGREVRRKHEASKVAGRRFIRNVSREREGRLAS
jgi:hypothetical protein